MVGLNVGVTRRLCHQSDQLHAGVKRETKINEPDGKHLAESSFLFFHETYQLIDKEKYESVWGWSGLGWARIEQQASEFGSTICT